MPPLRPNSRGTSCQATIAPSLRDISQQALASLPPTDKRRTPVPAAKALIEIVFVRKLSRLYALLHRCRLIRIFDIVRERLAHVANVALLEIHGMAVLTNISAACSRACPCPARPCNIFVHRVTAPVSGLVPRFVCANRLASSAVPPPASWPR